jgi:hypothetical protein
VRGGSVHEDSLPWEGLIFPEVLQLIHGKEEVRATSSIGEETNARDLLKNRDRNPHGIQYNYSKTVT